MIQDFMGKHSRRSTAAAPAGNLPPYVIVDGLVNTFVDACVYQHCGTTPQVASGSYGGLSSGQASSGQLHVPVAGDHVFSFDIRSYFAGCEIFWYAIIDEELTNGASKRQCHLVASGSGHASNVGSFSTYLEKDSYIRMSLFPIFRTGGLSTPDYVIDAQLSYVRETRPLFQPSK